MTNPPKDQNTALPTSLPEELQVWLDGYFSDPNAERSDRLVLALLSHIKTLEMQGKWLPIEDAPRDGSVFLAINMNGNGLSVPNPYFLCFSSPGNYEATAGWRSPGQTWPAYPTHFQYINPPTPAAQPEGGEG